MKRILAGILAVILICLCPGYPGVAFADGVPTMTVSQASAFPGEEVELTVSLSDNPGIYGMTLHFDYDTSRLELLSGSVSGLGGTAFVKTSMTWMSPAEDITYNGVFLTLRFRALDSAPVGFATVTITYGEDEVLNYADENVYFTIIAGGVDIKAHVHTLTAYPEKPTTCTEAGNIAYWVCSDCGKYFNDAAGANEIAAGSVIIPAPGHNLIPCAEVKATCTKTGNIAYWTCSACDKQFSDAEGNTEVDNVVTPIVPHSYASSWTHNEAEHWHECEYGCGTTSGKESHNLKDIVDQAATCTEKGSKHRECVCGYALAAVDIPATGHTLTLHEAKAATCSEAGNIAYWSCGACGKLYSDAEAETEIALSDTVVPTRDHSLEQLSEKAATCTETGNIACWKCSACGKYFSDSLASTEIAEENAIIPMVPHTLTPHNAKEATCTEKGNIAYWSCGVCSGLFSDASGANKITPVEAEIAALGHDLTAHDEKMPTCSEPGNIAYWDCGRCGKLFSDASGETEVTDVVTPIVSHKFSSEWSYDSDKHWHECTFGCGTKDAEADHSLTAVTDQQPTCTEKGSEHEECDCGYKAAATEIPATDHDFGEWEETKAPTLTTDGEETRSCQNPGCNVTETRPVKPTIYTVTYDANGGSGAPAAQKKLKGSALTLSSTKPSFDGYVFAGWAVSSTATEVDYASGASYIEDADVTLYAVWKPLTQTIRLYNALLSDDSLNGQTVTVDMASIPTLSLDYDTEPADALQTLTWKSSSTAIATVDADGLVTFVKPGTVTITATAQDGSGKSASVKFSVIYKDAATSFTAKLDSTSSLYQQPTNIGLQVGDSAAMFTFGADKTTAMNPRDFDYSVNNALVTVDEDGVITAVKSGGSSTVTATLRGDPLERKVTVTVKTIPVQISTISIVPYDESDASFVGVDANGNLTEIEGEAVSYALLVDKIEKGQPARTFRIKAVAADALGEEIGDLKGQITWASTGTGIASVKEAADGTVLITVNPNVDGAVTITGTAKDQQKSQGSLAVYVRDYTPRLGAASLSLDTQQAGSASLALVASYGNEITGVQLLTYDSVSKDYLPTADFDAAYNNETLTVTANTFLKNQTVKAQLLVSTDRGKYRLNLNLVIKNVTPAVTVKQPQRFNLFCLDSQVELAVTVAGISTEDIRSMRFEGTDSFRSETYENDGKLGIVYGNPTTKLNAKGTLYIEVEGYANEIEKAVTISTVNTKPSLVLTPASGTINPLMGEASVLTAVYNNTAKELLDMTNVTVSTTTAEAIATVEKAGSEIRITAAEGSSGGRVDINLQDENWLTPISLNYSLSVKNELPTAKAAKTTLTLNSLYPSTVDSTAITLSLANLEPANLASAQLIPAKPSDETGKLDVSFANGEIVASVTDDSVKAGSYSYSFAPEYNGVQLAKVTVTVKVVNTRPSVKLSKTSLTLNSVFSDQTDTLSVIPTNSSQSVSGVEVVPAAAAGTAARAEADKLSLDWDGEVLTAGIRPGETVKPGSYSFKLTASCRDGVDAPEANPVSFTVKVVNTVPKVALSATTLNLNTVLAGSEQAGLSIASTTAGYSVVSCRVERTDTTAALLAESRKITVSGSGDTVLAMLDNANIARAGSYKYRVYATVEDENTNQRVELAALNFTVKVFTNANYNATVSASGKLDAAARASSGITYTLTKLNNVSGSVADVRLEGKDAAKFDIVLGAPNAKGQPTARLSLKTDEDYATNVSYSVKQVYTLDSGIDVATGSLTVRVTQTALKITAVPAAQTIYQSQSRDRTVTYTLKLTAPTGAAFGEIETGNVGLLQSSLVDQGNVEIVLNGDTATVTVLLKDTSKLAAGKTYTLPLLIQAEGQATNLAPTKLNLSLKVAK